MMDGWMEGGFMMGGASGCPACIEGEGGARYD